MPSIHHDPPRVVPPDENPQNLDAFHQRLEATLGSLPKERASLGFTQQVLERVDQTRSVQRQWQALAAAALVLLALGLGFHQWQRHEERQAALARLTQMQVEYAQIAGELSNLQKQAEKARPVVYLSGTESDVELVLDLSRLALGSALAQEPRKTNEEPASPDGMI